MIDIHDFIGFAKSQGFTVEYRAKLGESLVFDVYRSANNRRPGTRFDSRNSNIIWFINDYDISGPDLEKLVEFYHEGCKKINERANSL